MTLRYAAGAARRDLARAGAGLLVTAGPLVAVPLAWPAEIAFACATVLFLAFGYQAIARARIAVTLDPDGVRVEPGGRRLAWDALDGLDIAYYQLRRDGDEGWFELRARSTACTLRVDSRLEGFDALVHAAAGAASRRGLELDTVTRENLRAVLPGPLDV